MTTDTHVKMLEDAALLSATTKLAKQSNEVTADLLLHLAEVDARKLYLGRAFPSMFAFCVGTLGLSEDAAYTLIHVARLTRNVPAALGALRDGRIHLTGLRLLAAHVTPENADAVLAQASRKSKRAIEELVACLAPKPDVPDSIRRLPAPSPLALPPLEVRSAPLTPAPTVSPQPSVVSFPPAPMTPARRTSVAPLSEDSFKVQFTASRALRDKLREAQGLLRHSVPDGDLAEVVERAVDLLLADAKKKRFGIGCTPRSRKKAEQVTAECEAPPTPQAKATSSRHVPMDIRRAVHERDAGQCTFVDDSGRRCEETAGLELDHVDGFARTHVHSVEGLRLRCRPHNQHAAEQLYGRGFMEAARAKGRTRDMKRANQHVPEQVGLLAVELRVAGHVTPPRSG